MDGKKLDRIMFNTTIDRETQDLFKKSCKDKGVAMNVVLETFMRHFYKGEFVLTLGKNTPFQIEENDGVDESDNQNK